VELAQPPEHGGLEWQRDVGGDREAVVVGADRPALEPVGGQRQVVANDVAQVGPDVGLIVGLRLVEVADLAVEHRPERPSRGHRLAAGETGQGPDRQRRVARRDHVVQRWRGRHHVPGVRPAGVELEAHQLGLRQQEAVGTGGDELRLREVAAVGPLGNSDAGPLAGCP